MTSVTRFRTQWRKSSYSLSESQCVEVSSDPRSVAVRDSKHPERSLAFSAGQWRAFVSGVKNDEFDR